MRDPRTHRADSTVGRSPQPARRRHWNWQDRKWNRRGPADAVRARPRLDHVTSSGVVAEVVGVISVSPGLRVGRVVQHDFAASKRELASPPDRNRGRAISASPFYKLRDIIQLVDRRPTPSLLPIFRSQQQAELLALILGDAAAEYTLAELAERTSIPYASVHREVERAAAAGLVTSRLVGRSRLIRADSASPYFNGLSDVLVKAFGVPWVLGQALASVGGVDAAYVYGSWAARFSGEEGDRPVGDIDLLVLGGPDRDKVYAAASSAERRLGRAVQVTIRSADWLTEGSGTFHDTVAGRPMVSVALGATGTARGDQSPTAARQPRRRSATSSVPTPSPPR